MKRSMPTALVIYCYNECKQRQETIKQILSGAANAQWNANDAVECDTNKLHQASDLLIQYFPPSNPTITIEDDNDATIPTTTAVKRIHKPQPQTQPILDYEREHQSAILNHFWNGSKKPLVPPTTASKKMVPPTKVASNKTNLLQQQMHQVMQHHQQYQYCAILKQK